MEYRELGKTGLKISRLGFGGIPIQRIEKEEVKVLFGLAEDYDEDKAKCGIARGIDKDGALIVETKLETLHVVSGEVSVRGLYGYV